MHDELLALEEEILTKFPCRGDEWVTGLNILGSSFIGMENSGPGSYIIDPINCAVLSDTGVDGFHFVILVRDGRIDETCPVYAVAPACSGELPMVVGDSFRSFLRFGLCRGFFGLSYLYFDLELTLLAYSSQHWHSTVERHDSNGLVPSEREWSVLRFVREKLRLEPLSYTRQEFEELQNKYMPLLAYSAEWHRRYD
ncbi:MAG: hypothetical protein ACKVP0_12580 [Pirellulaceae bacterium]